MTVKVSPVLVNVTDTPYKPGVIVGGDACLGDDLDATYAEQWLSLRGGVGEGALVIADFDPYDGGVASVALRMRFEVANELDATGTRFFVAAYHDGDEVGLFHIPGFPTEFPSVASTDTIYDITDWTFEQTSETTTLNEALLSGLEIRTRRLPQTDAPGDIDGDWMIRVYELNMLASGGSPPLRRYPRSDGLGVGPVRHFPLPATGQRSLRRVGGTY